MATGGTRIRFCDPTGVNGIICEAVRRRRDAGDNLRIFQIVARHVESWDLSIGPGTTRFNEEWESTQYVVGTGPFDTEEWNLTTYTPVKVTIQTEFPGVTEPWEVTNQFFHIVGVQEEWNVTEYSTEEDSLGPIGATFIEEWEN